MVFVLVFVLLAVTVLLASASSIRSILNLKPAEVLMVAEFIYVGVEGGNR